MNEESRITRLIRKNIRLFSGLLFTLSAILLFILNSISEINFSSNFIIWLGIAEEVTKGLLTAAAVTFLYDWILKEESTEEISIAVSQELRKQLAGVKAKEGGYTRQDYVFEAILHPFEDTPETSSNNFCRFCVHTKFRSPYLGDKITFALVSTREQVEKYRKDPTCIFRWQLDEFPRNSFDEAWLDVTNFRVSGQIWKKDNVRVNHDSVIVSFRRSSPLIKHPSDVLYDFDLRTIEVLKGEKLHVDHFTFHTLINATFRVDARALGSKKIYADMSFSLDNVYQGPYVNSPEGYGSWKIYYDGILEPIQTIRFSIEDV